MRTVCYNAAAGGEIKKKDKESKVMKYTVETNGESYTETLEVDSRRYTKKWIQSKNGVRSTDEDFSDQLEADGANEEFVEDVRENIDDSLFGYDFFKML